MTLHVTRNVECYKAGYAGRRALIITERVEQSLGVQHDYRHEHGHSQHK